MVDTGGTAELDVLEHRLGAMADIFDEAVDLIGSGGVERDFGWRNKLLTDKPVRYVYAGETEGGTTKLELLVERYPTTGQKDITPDSHPIGGKNGANEKITLQVSYGEDRTDLPTEFGVQESVVWD